MDSTVKLSRVDGVLEELTYPIECSTAASEFEGVTVLLADGEVDLGELIAKSDRPRFESVPDLRTELHNVLPRKAVGEPYQSEGEG